MTFRTTRNAALGLLLLCGTKAQSQLTALPAHPAPSAVAGAEYFFGSDPGFGAGIALPLNPGQDISQTPLVSLTQLTPGSHRLYMRCRNAAGLWSHTQSRVLVIYSLITALPQTAAAVPVAGAEYFIDADPGPGNGVPVSLPGPGADLSATNVPVDISGLSPGLHRICFRTRDLSGNWSHSSGAGFTIIVGTLPGIPAHPAIRPVTAVEYFIDTDPGWGNGTVVNIPATTDLRNESIAVDITGLAPGAHTFFMRSLNGHSMTSAQAFSINGAALPLHWTSFTATAATTYNRVDWQLANAGKARGFRVERSPDGRQFTRIGIVDAGNDIGDGQDYTFRDAAPLPGVSYYRLILEYVDGTECQSPVMSLRRGTAAAEIRINNPVTGSLIVRRIGEGASDMDLRIHDLSGLEVMHPGRSAETVQRLDVSALPAGIYILSWDAGGKAAALRFIRQ